jgi:Aspartyl protease
MHLMSGRALAALFFVVVLPATAVFSGPAVILGPSDGLAFDQPRVAVEVIDESAPGGPRSLGPEAGQDFLLDTGATSVVIAGGAYSNLLGRSYVTEGTYLEQGVAGFTEMDVSRPYRFDVAGNSGIRQTIHGARLMSNASLNFGSFGGIAGMPLMMGRTVTMDFSVWSGGALTTMLTDFPDTPPPSAGHRYHVPLEMVSFAQSGQIAPNDPLPVWAPLPFVQVEARHGAQRAGGKFVVDTGAQLSILSSSVAFALGLDADGDGDFEHEKQGELEVGGIGGMVTMPLLSFDALRLPTSEGVDLAWTDVQVGVLDIDPSIAGVFGQDLLTSGWLAALLGLGEGYFDQVHFDFRTARSGMGTMLFDLNPAKDSITYPTLARGDMNGDEVIDNLDIAAFVQALSDPAGYRAAFPWINASVIGDVNLDGQLDNEDIAPFGDLLVGGSATAVPEPSGAVLSLLASVYSCVVIRLRRFSRGVA